jgi:hypothetical protein
MSNLESSVRDSISRYVSELASVSDLSHQLPDGWALDEQNDPQTTKLVMLVMGYLADYDNGHLNELELRQRLASEASWQVQRSLDGGDMKLLIPPKVETSVRVGAGRPLRKALAS